MNSNSYTSVSAISTFALTEWIYKSYSDSKTYVLPDGCRDIIIKQNDVQPEAWFLSDLDEASYSIKTEPYSEITGIRLRPGVNIDLNRLSAWLKGRSLTNLFGTDQIDEFCIEAINLTEALDCLGSDEITGASSGVTAGAASDEITGVTPYKTLGESPVVYVAKQLGVSVRTLQRLVKSGTGQSPYFWFSLARARKAAKVLMEYKTLGEAAYHLGYADQAHMTREMKKWFGKTPSQICIDSEFQDVISEPGYG